MIENKPLTTYVAAFLDELVRSGVNQIVISPGSRSTPIAMVAAEHPDMKVWLNVDERSAAFFGLGVAKARREPVAIVCTSGTAVANYMPAVVEAKESQVPLIILTADRPHELRDIGAPQAIDQLDFFGKQVKWFVEMALPEDNPEMLRYVRTIAARAVSTSLRGPSGPVHLNFPFREPLVPSIEDDNIWKSGLENRHQYVKVSKPILDVAQGELHRLAEELSQIERGLIVCGPYDKPGFTGKVATLSEALNFPMIADPLSQLRSGQHNQDLIIDSYDAFLRDEYIASELVPEAIIRFGAMPVSKALLLFLKKNPQIKQFIVDGDGLWRDPSLLGSEMIHADPISFCQSMNELIASKSNNQLKRTASASWTRKWVTANQIARDSLEQLARNEQQFEGQVVLRIADCLPENSTFFVGNSMPIRDVDSFFLTNRRNVRIMANRGANGIDGTISTALGVSTGAGPTLLLVGDLTFYHDLNGLLAAKLHQLNVTIIIVNNEGGGIFSFLPQSEHPKHFELLFGTPLGLDYSHVVKMYGGDFHRIENWNELSEAIEKSLQTDGLNVIEIRTDRSLNAEKHRKIWKLTNEQIKHYWNLGENNVHKG